MQHKYLQQEKTGVRPSLDSLDYEEKSWYSAGRSRDQGSRVEGYSCWDRRYCSGRKMVTACLTKSWEVKTLGANLLPKEEDAENLRRDGLLNQPGTLFSKQLLLEYSQGQGAHFLQSILTLSFPKSFVTLSLTHSTSTPLERKLYKFLKE